MSKKDGMSGAMKMGLGVAAISAAAIGTYMLTGKRGEKNRKVVKGWMLKAKGELLEQLENGKEISMEAYDALVEAIGDKYSEMKEVSAADLAGFIKELKNTGKTVVAGAKKKGKSMAGKAKGSMKKMAGKPMKKAKSMAKKSLKK